MIDRRVFLKNTGLAAVGLSMAPAFLQRTAVAAVPSTGSGKILVTIFQRGGADGLNIVVPHGDDFYYEHRPSIAIRRPDPQRPSVLDLDGFFGLHPQLESLLPIYQAGDLAFVHAVGSRDSSRSHFEAQDYMESAAPGSRSVRSGWLNRYLQAKPDAQATYFRATAMTETLPRSLHGEASALAVGNLNTFGAVAGMSIYQSLYSDENNALLAGTARDLYGAVDMLEAANPRQYRPAKGVRYPGGPNNQFSIKLQQVAQLIKANIGLEVAFVDVGGWDHHRAEGGVEGRMAVSLAQMGGSLSAFYQDLGDRMEDVVVLTMSEFGRTVRENGNRGTDHGHGNVMFVMGGGINGGKVYTDWPGLAPENLNENRDLAITTDFRDVFAEILVKHLNCREPDKVFPDFELDAQRFRGLV